MKTIKQILFIILLCISYNSVTAAQNLVSMPIAKRDSLLIAIAKEVVLKYGPDYYREDFKPIIEQHSVPPKGEINKTGEMAGRIFYWIIIRYDEIKEQLNYPFSARVQVWADIGKPSSVFFGNGLGITVSENDLRSSEEIEPIPYRQRQVVPRYEMDSSNKIPLNLDELKRKGYVEQSDGNWVKTTKDTPPAEAQRVIKRAQAEMKKKIK